MESSSSSKKQKLTVNEDISNEVIRNDNEKEKQPEETRNWADLPAVLVLTIFSYLDLVPDLFAFTFATRRLMRSLGPLIPCCRPPLLLKPRLFISHSVLTLWEPIRALWFQPEVCLLETLNGCGNYRSMVSPQTLTRNCIGYSYGYLIFADEEKIILADVFTGIEIVSPLLVGVVKFSCYAILTAHPSSASAGSTLVLVGLNSVRFWRIGRDRWTVEFELAYNRGARCAVEHGGQVYFLNYFNYTLTVVDLHPDGTVSRRRSIKTKIYAPFVKYGNFERYLTKFGEDILLVLFAFDLPTISIRVYRYDFTISEWVRLRSLGDWCLFIDAIARSPIACSNPSRWGGRRDCVYIAGPGRNDWSVFPLNRVVKAQGTALDPLFCTMSAWPSSVWVYPSMHY